MPGTDDTHQRGPSYQSDRLAYWHHRILDHYSAARTDFEQMRKLRTQRQEWFDLCHALAWNYDSEVRTFALRQLAFYGDKDDAEAEAAALDVLRQMPEKVREVTPEYPHRITPERHLQIAAFLALGRVGTEAAYNVLYAHARAGDEFALLNAAEQARTAEQQEQMIVLARQFLRLDRFSLSYKGLQVLMRFSTAEREQNLLLEVAQKNRYDFAIYALGHTNPSMLPAIRDLLEHVSPNTAQYVAARTAIAELEQREQQMRSKQDRGDQPT